MPDHGLPLRGFAITLVGPTTLGVTPLYEWSVLSRDLSLTTHNTLKRKTSMPPTGFEPTIPASERPQTRALDIAATWIGKSLNKFYKVSDRLFLMALFQVHMSYRMMKYKILHTSAQRPENFGKTVSLIPCIREHCTVWMRVCSFSQATLTPGQFPDFYRRLDGL